MKLSKIKDKERILKTAREKQCYLHGKPIRLWAGVFCLFFFKQALQSKESGIILKEKNQPIKNILPGKWSLRVKKIESFPDKQKQKEYIATRPALQKY